MGLKHSKGMRLLAKVASAPIVMGIAVVHEIKEELREKTVEEYKNEAKAQYRKAVDNIMEKARIQELRDRINEYKKAKGLMTKNEVKIMELEAELERLKATARPAEEKE